MKALGGRLVEAVAPLVRPLGFRYVAKRSSFFRKTQYGFDHFLWTSHPGVVNGTICEVYSLVVSVRHDPVEDIVNQLGLVHGAENRQNTSTVSCAFELFPPSVARRYTFALPHAAPDQAVGKTAASMALAFEKDGLPFYARYASLAECAAGLNSEPQRRAHHLCNNIERRMYTAITAGCLAHFRDRQELFEMWRAVCPEVLPESQKTRVSAKLKALEEILVAMEIEPQPVVPPDVPAAASRRQGRG